MEWYNSATGTWLPERVRFGATLADTGKYSRRVREKRSKQTEAALHPGTTFGELLPELRSEIERDVKNNYYLRGSRTNRAATVLQNAWRRLRAILNIQLGSFTWLNGPGTTYQRGYQPGYRQNINPPAIMYKVRHPNLLSRIDPRVPGTTCTHAQFTGMFRMLDKFNSAAALKKTYVGSSSRPPVRTGSPMFEDFLANLPSFNYLAPNTNHNM